MNSNIKTALFFTQKELTNLNKFLNLFTQTKIKDALRLNVLNMDYVSKQINLQRISMLVNHNTIGYRNSSDFDFYDEWAALYTNLFKYYYQYYLKQRLYLLDQIEPGDLERTHPLFRHKIAHKNKDHIKGLFSFLDVYGKSRKTLQINENHNILKKKFTFSSQPVNNEIVTVKKEADQMMDFLKLAMDKFLPNLSELWHLNDLKPPPIMVLKVIKLLLKYSVLKKKQLVKIMDLLMDKAVILKNLEQIYYNELAHNEALLKESLSISRKLEGPLDSKRIKPEDLHKWGKVFIIYRQLYSEIFMLMMLYSTDDKMDEILRKNVDINIEFEDSQINMVGNFTKKDLVEIENIENNANFEELGIFEEEQGKNYMSIFFGYIMSSPLNPPNRFNNKMKNMVKIFLNFFANVNDINLPALKLMNSDVKLLLKRPLYLTLNEQTSSENIAIKDFSRYCKECYLMERKNLEYSDDFKEDFHKKLEEIHKVLAGFIPESDKAKIYSESEKAKIQEMLFQHNFLWTLLNVILKFSQELEGCQDLFKKVMELFELCLDKNLYFQNMMIQGKVLKLLEIKKEKLGRIGVELVRLAFKNNPTLMVSNQNYLNLFFNYSKKCAESQQIFASEEDYYQSRAKFYELLSHYLDEKYYGSSNAIPEYDLICLDNILNTEYTEAEFLNAENIIEILNNRNEPQIQYKVDYLKHIINIIAKSSSKRSTKENNKRLRDLFPIASMRKMLQIVSDDYEIKTNLFRLFRNIYIFDKDNIFDDDEKIYEHVRPPPTASNVPSMKKPLEKQSLDVPVEETKKTNKKGKGGANDDDAKINNKENDEVIAVIKKEFSQFVQDSKMSALKDEKEKQLITTYGVTMLMSTINYISKVAIQTRLVTFRRMNIIKQQDESNKPLENLKQEQKQQPTSGKNMLFWILEQMKDEETSRILRKIFDLNENKEKKKVHLFEDIELDPLPETLKQEVYKFDELVNLCEIYSSGKEKEAYKIYNLGASTDVVKRFSNKLEDRQASVRLPFEIMKTLFLAYKEKSPENSLGMIMGAIYESFKLRKLSTFSSMKKNYEDQAIDNIYLRILKDSAEKKDLLASNLCKFLFSELGGGLNDPNKFTRSVTKLSEFSSVVKGCCIINCEGCLGTREDEDAANFVTGKRNNKYVLLEIFSNVLFHATEVFQEYIFEMLKKPDEDEVFVYFSINLNIFQHFNNFLYLFRRGDQYN